MVILPMHVNDSGNLIVSIDEQNYSVSPYSKSPELAVWYRSDK